MEITYQASTDLNRSASITFNNMKRYYDHFSVDWDVDNIASQILSLENLDILLDGNIVGAIRLAFEDKHCWIRDLQVDQKAQNRGIGSKALVKCEAIAIEKKSTCLKLRVFQMSPAVSFYLRAGFIIDEEDDRFFYMSRQIN